MKAQVSEFRTPTDEQRFRETYTELVERHWPAVPRTELDVPTDFGTTRVRRSGDRPGTPIVMLHPTMGGSIGLYPFIEPLTRHRVVYTPDTMGTPGHNDQTKPIVGPRDLAAWLDQTLDALGLDRVHLAGYSKGGYVACLAAALSTRPDRVATLTLLEPGGAIGDIRKSTMAGLAVSGIRLMFTRDKREGMKRIGRWLNGGSHELSDDILDYARLGATRFRHRNPWPRKLPDHQLQRIAAPTHLLLGGRSRLYDPRALADRAERLLPDLTTHIVAQGGHGFGYDAPEETMTRVLTFIADRESRPTRS
ncbi:pimeloyl-ACP methyl ester carboxylesterase [Stackebrandtia endophytica]|uniref:Pimeloyl-ACP methyl ester carboxylesterase n=1 Tax=Stackebrandtia endophytica TaxID=1496996 RepID=A0A543ARA9_9ACTN|nr:alpha/beta hydrolase [Stackebrandtia endophytica]TQL75112.1 pimeloyl-ACP methyl ester carboxylesterase [Stackebrandtia endophytica]